MHDRKLAKRAVKLFKMGTGIKIASAAGTSAQFISKVKQGYSFLPERFIPALVEAYGEKGITAEYLHTLTAEWGNEHD